MRILPISAGLALLFVSALAHGGDSPQFRGPNRDGRFDEQGLLKEWPDGGPPLLWTAKGLGQGYASASVSRGKIYVPGMQDDQTASLFVLNRDGIIEKKIPYGKETLDDQAPGPRSTPTVEGDRVYLFSGLGVVYCLDTAKGEVLWEVDALKRFHAKNSRWNIAESLLLDGDRVICTPGGPDALLAALDKT
ncbi:MAG TPA: PQQ-binding-like beta-propeller repeat protein, partial [Candidatus Hydrogenedentes bacterium]|nr:PQQ-binding-like beta-propeller repeat protein [Candidatus Hydrogenedentota bacterium]